MQVSPYRDIRGSRGSSGVLSNLLTMTGDWRNAAHDRLIAHPAATPKLKSAGFADARLRFG